MLENEINDSLMRAFPFLRKIINDLAIDWYLVSSGVPLHIMACGSCVLDIEEDGGEAEVITFLVDSEGNILELPFGTRGTARKTEAGGYLGQYLSKCIAASEILKHLNRGIEFVVRKISCPNPTSPASIIRYIEICKTNPETLEESCKIALQFGSTIHFNPYRMN